MNYPIGDFLIRIKNAKMAGKRVVEVKSIKFIKETAKVLQRLGYLDKVEEEGGRLLVRLTFHKKKPLILNIKLVSKPGMRIYKSVDDLESIKKPSVFIVSTSKGVMSSKEAIKKRLGGEVIAEIL